MVRAASIRAERAPTAPMNVVTISTPGGIGPRTTIPASPCSSLCCWKPRSASPPASNAATGFPGGAGGIADAPRREQWAAEGFVGGDVGTRAIERHRDRDARLDDRHATVGYDVAGARERVDRVCREHDEVDRFSRANASDVTMCSG